MSTVSTRKRVTVGPLELAGYLALAAAAGYVLAAAAGGVLDPSYSQVRQHVSDLTATGAPTWSALAPLYLLHNVLAGANPDTTVALAGEVRSVRGRAATPEERPRLWTRWAEFDGEENLASWAARRPRETAVVILEPRHGRET
jgi:hypothetical protein